NLGAMRANIPGLAYEIGWDVERLSKAFGEALRKAFLEDDETVSFLSLTNFLRYNSPESPNVVKSWEKSLDLLPECPLKNRLIIRIKSLSEGFPKAFREALPKAFRKSFERLSVQEQEQEQEYKERKSVCVSSSGRRPDKPEISTGKTTHTHTPAADFVLTKELREMVEQASSD